MRPPGQSISRTGGKPIKIDIVVHGRFHGFALGKALLELGHDVVVHTNYPRSVVEEFGIPRKLVRSFLAHGIGTRLSSKLGALQPMAVTEPFFHKLFGRWAARSVRPDSDLIYGFSGVMKELLRSPRCHAGQLRAVVRGSSHIREQARLLEEEERRVGVPIDRPSPWMIAREEKEYLLADCILVLSSFAFNSFVEQGVDRRRLLLNPLGVNLSQFSPEADVIEARVKRVMSGEPLRVLNVGTFSFRKGAADLVHVAQALESKIELRFVGDRPKECQHLLRTSNQYIAFNDRVPEAKLNAAYKDADIFIFPTIEDGFAAVLLQAQASGLPIIATPNSSAPDFLEEGKTGWVVPIRRADLFIQRLEWCDANRAAVASMVKYLGLRKFARTWSDMAHELMDHYYAIAKDLRGSRFSQTR
ncbi:MAG: glycosyltransferase family 4 protein [Hyphomicrobiaceae bacterium]|nr:MAG: glycosyltransferase family 4 protein [Hyphomicrobiaceae bacterium]